MSSSGYNFCDTCGQATVAIDAGYYNTMEGGRATRQVCSDPRCVRGCEERGTHKGSGWLRSGPCRACGSSLVSLCDAF